MTKYRSCWCGNQSLNSFSSDYLVCNGCSTLISQKGLRSEQILVKNDEEDFYGKKYWLSHQQNDLGCPDIFKRSRSDLSDRCIHWLRTILKYKLPPAKTLELGSSHGGFVSMLRQCGYDAMGLELSPWIADFASKTFNIPMLIGPIEGQDIEKSSLDLIVLLDVLEHLPDPLATLKTCFNFLKEDGIIVIQTPCFPSQKSYENMIEENSPFLSQLEADEHLYLFSKDSIVKFFKQIDSTLEFQFEPAIFARYDMFVMVSRRALSTHSEIEIDDFLSNNHKTRILQAILDLDLRYHSLFSLYQESEVDRANRLEIMNKLENEIKVLIKTIEEMMISNRKAIEEMMIINRLKKAYNEFINRLSNIPKKIKQLLNRFIRKVFYGNS